MDLFHIINRSASILEVEINDEGAMELARRSRGTPRLANRILRRARDFAQVEASGEINLEVAKYSLKKLGIDQIARYKLKTMYILSLELKVIIRYIMMVVMLFTELQEMVI